MSIYYYFFGCMWLYVSLDLTSGELAGGKQWRYSLSKMHLFHLSIKMKEMRESHHKCLRRSSLYHIWFYLLPKIKTHFDHLPRHLAIQRNETKAKGTTNHIE